MSVRPAPTSLVFGLRLLALGVAYLAAAKGGLYLAFTHPSATPIWPPTGIALAALILWGRGYWPAIFVGAFVANVSGPTSTLAALGIAAGNTMEAVIGAALAGALAGGRDAFDRPSTIFRWVVLVGLVSSALSATIGLLSLIAAGLLPLSRAGPVWLTWWLGDAGGALVVAPFLILWGRELRVRWNGRQAGELLLLCTVVAVLSGLGFGVPFRISEELFPLGYAFFPALAWSAFRLGPRPTISVAVGVAVLALWGTLSGQGPFATADRNVSLLLVQGYVSVMTTTAIALAAAVRERREAERLVSELNDELERRVAERTREVGKSQTMLSQAEGLAHLGSWDWDVTADTLRWSDELYRIYGLDPAGKVAGSADFLSRIHPEDRARSQVVIDQALRDGRPFDFVHRIVRPDGGIRTLHALGEAVVDSAGKPQHLFGTARDITGEREREELERTRVALEEALRSKEEILASISTGFLALDRELRFRYANPAAVELFHTPREHLIGKGVAAGTLAERELRRALRDNVPVHFEEYLADWGRWYEQHAYPTSEGLTLLVTDITARKAAQEALRAGEERLRLMAEQVPAILWTTDDHLVITSSLGRGLAGLGLQAGQLVGSRVEDFLGGQEAAVSAHRRALQEGIPTRYEGFYAGRPFESHVEPLKDGRGHVVGLVGVGLDLSERKKAEEAQARLAAIVASSQDAIVSKSLSGVITSWNAAAQRLFGYAEEEVLGKHISILIPAERHHEEREIIAKVAHGEVVDSFDSVRRRKDGTLIDVSLCISPIRGADGTVIGASKVARDIRERRRIEEERRRREAELEALQEQLARQVSDLQVLHSLSSRLVSSLNPDELMREILAAAVDLQGARMGFLELVDPERDALYVSAAVGHRPEASGRVGFIPIAEGQGASGTAAARRDWVVVEDVESDELFAPFRDFARWAGFRCVWSAPLLGRRGELLGVLSTHHGRPRRPSPREMRLVDLYARYAASAIEGAQLYKRAQDEVAVRMAKEAEVRRLNDDLENRVRERTAALEEMVRELDTFAYTVAHDLRAPIRAMQGFSHLLIEDFAPQLGEQGRDLADRIARAGERMDALIRDLLAYSRLSREDVQLAPVDLGRLAAEVVAEAEPEIAARGADVRAEGPLPAVLGHEVTLRQAVTNLVSNALKFTAPGVAPRVRIRAESRDDRVRIWVEDNGIGIAPRDQARLFRVFERVHAGDKYPGTGIGLAIVRRALERMNGSVGLLSEPEHGSRFWIELRAAGVPAASRKA